MRVAARHLVVALAGAVAVASGVSAAYGGSSRSTAATREVSIPARVFAPGEIQVLLGDTVVWRNGDGTNHTVTSDDDLFDSGFIAPGLTYAQAFTKTGTFLYHCTIHKTMRGEVIVVPVALTAPAEPVISGGRIVLQGFAPTGTTRVVVNRLGDGGKVVGRVAPAGDGSFTLSLRVLRPADFNAGCEGPRVAARARRGRAEGGRAPQRRHGVRRPRARSGPAPRSCCSATCASCSRGGTSRRAGSGRCRRARSRCRARRDASASSSAAATAGRTASRPPSSSSEARLARVS